jgi:type IV secretion system protein VirB6
MSFLSTLEAKITGFADSIMFAALGTTWGDGTAEAISRGLTPGSSGNALIWYFQQAFVVGFMIWIMIIGYDVIYGRSEESLGYMMKKIFRIFFIGTFALFAWPQLAELFMGVRDALVRGLAGDLTIIDSGGTRRVVTISAILDAKLIDPLYTGWFLPWWDWLGSSAASFSSAPSPAKDYWVATGGVFAVVGGIALGISVLSLSLYLLSSVCFSLLLAIGPIFLLCLVFPFLKRYFESWCGALITCCLAMAFTALLVSLIGLVTDIGSVTPPTSITDYAEFRTYVTGLFPRAAAGLFVILLFQKVSALASALGGGLHIGGNILETARSIAQDARSGLAAGGSQAGAGMWSRFSGQGSLGIQSGRNSLTNNVSDLGNRQSPMQALARNRTALESGASVLETGGAAAGRGVMSVGQRVNNGVRR